MLGVFLTTIFTYNDIKFRLITYIVIEITVKTMRFDLSVCLCIALCDISTKGLQKKYNLPNLPIQKLSKI